MRVIIIKERQWETKGHSTNCVLEGEQFISGSEGPEIADREPVRWKPNAM